MEGRSRTPAGSAYDTTEDLTGLSWRDELWLQYNPLNEVTVLRDYFALSPFYDPECNNEIARIRNMDFSKLPFLPPGVEYVVQSAQDPHLYVIRKQYRNSLKSTSTQAFYYVHTGTVYQAPSLHAALLSRWKRCLFCLTKAFRKMQADLDPLREWRRPGKTQAKQGSAEVKRLMARDQQEKLQEGLKIITGALSQFRPSQSPSLPPAPTVPAPTAAAADTPHASSQPPAASPHSAPRTPGELSLPTTDDKEEPKRHAIGASGGEEGEVTKKRRLA